MCIKYYFEDFLICRFLILSPGTALPFDTFRQMETRSLSKDAADALQRVKYAKNQRRDAEK